MLESSQTASGPKECDCGGHHHARHGEVARSGWAAALLAIMACAVCPACLSTYAKLLSVFGMGIGLDALAHERLTVAALVASITISAWRSWRTRRAWPLSAALLGAGLVGAGHWLDELHALEWLGMLILLAGALAEHFRLRAHSKRRALMATPVATR